MMGKFQYGVEQRLPVGSLGIGDGSFNLRPCLRVERLHHRADATSTQVDGEDRQPVSGDPEASGGAPFPGRRLMCFNQARQAQIVDDRGDCGAGEARTSGHLDDARGLAGTPKVVEDDTGVEVTQSGGATGIGFCHADDHTLRLAMISADDSYEKSLRIGAASDFLALLSTPPWFAKENPMSQPASRVRRRAALALTAALALLAPAPAVHAAPAAASATTPTQMTAARAAFERILGPAAANFDLAVLSGDDDRYEVTAAGARTRIAATTPATAVAGLNAYLGSVNQSVSWTVRNVDPTANFPAPETPITATANVDHRFYGNDTDDGYTGAYRTFADWEVLIDDLAALGFNEVFMPVGTEAVYLDVLQEFGYTEAEALAWIPTPSHQPWWLLQNMSGFPGGMTLQAVEDRAALGRQIADRLRELDMTPVLPGYFGTVPAGFAARNPGAAVVPQGGWVGFTRPDWLDPNTPVFADVAEAFYTSSSARLGAADGYKMDVLHEGGSRGNVNVPAASRKIESALQQAHPGALWYLLGWESNPPKDVLNALNKSTTFVVDGLSDRRASRDGEVDFVGTPWAYGSIWNFGGDTTMGAKLTTWNQKYAQWLNESGSTMNGVAVMPEGGLNNAVAIEFLAGLAWASGPLDVDAWLTDWTTRRYGAANADAAEAWRIIGETAYTLPTSGGYAEAHDSIYAADPSLTASRSSAWSPTTPAYDLERFADALPPLIAAGTALGASETYRYDLMDVSRQVLSNTARQLLPKIETAFVTKDAAEYDRLTAAWTSNMALLDDIAGTQDLALLGRLLDEASAAGAATGLSRAFEGSQRTILTTWAPRAGYNAGLGDYAGREIQGLINTYYAPRWEKYFADGRAALAAGAASIPQSDWFALSQPWLTSTDRTGIRSAATGDITALAPRVLDAVAVAEATPAAPLPPGEGTHYLSDLPFWEQQLNAAWGPIERDTEVGSTPAGDGRPLTLNGTVYAKGLGMQAPAWVTFNLGGQCSSFHAVVGPDDAMSGANQHPTITFRVSGDDHVLITTPELTKRQTHTIDLDVTGVDTLRLELDEGSSDWWDRGDWADAQVTCSEPAPLPTVEVETVAFLTCDARTVVVSVAVTNNGDVPLTSAVTTPHGTQADVRVAPGKSAHARIPTALASAPAGSASITTTATIGGHAVTDTRTASYNALACR